MQRPEVRRAGCLLQTKKCWWADQLVPEFDAKFGMSQTWYHFLHGGGLDRDI
jgi:hypothetical protein